jgi:hypothetical protein
MRKKVLHYQMPPLHVERDVDHHTGKARDGWMVFDESGNITEGPFKSRAEARRFLRDIKAGRMQLGGSARYAANRTPGERGETQAGVDAGKIAQKKYEAALHKWRRGGK